MSVFFNRSILGGNICRDIELKEVGSSQVANFSLAYNKRYKTKGGEQKEETLFIDCEAWGGTATFIEKFFSKGKGILVEGELKMDQWESDAGKRTKISIKVTQAYFNDSAKDDGQDTGGQSQGGRPSAPHHGLAKDTGLGEDDADSVPF